MKIGTLTTTLKVNIKLSLWSAIKLRISGLTNPFTKNKKITLEEYSEIKEGSNHDRKDEN